jgi:hypothetical protein
VRQALKAEPNDGHSPHSRHSVRLSTPDSRRFAATASGALVRADVFLCVLCASVAEFRDDDVRLKPDATLPIALSGALVRADVLFCVLCASVAKSFVMMTSG